MSLFKLSYYWLFAMLFIVNSITSLKGMEEASSQKDILQTKYSAVTLTPLDLYEWNILEHKTPEEIITLATQGTIAKIKKDVEKAISLLEQAAEYQNVGAIMNLADICQSQNQWLRATKWYVLAFQIHWLNTAEHHSKATEWLGNLPTQLKSIKQHLKDSEKKNFTSFINFLKAKKNNFFKCYPQKKKLEQQTFSSRNNLISTDGLIGMKPFINREKILALSHCKKIYEDNSHEHYLSTREKEAKSAWFWRMLITEGYSDDYMETEGQVYFHHGNFKKAIYCLRGINTPISLERLGDSYQKTIGLTRHQVTNFLLLKHVNLPADFFQSCILLYGQLDDLAPPYDEIIDFYKHAQTSSAYSKLGDLYAQGYFGAIDYQNAIKFYTLSGIPEALCLIGLWYEDSRLGEQNYQEAIKYYELSKSSLAYANLGNLWLAGKLGKVDYQKAAFFYLQSEEPNALQNLLHLCVDGRLNNETCQAAHSKLLKFQHPYKNLMLIYLYIRSEFCRKIELKNPEECISELTKKLLNNSKNLQPSQRAFVTGILESFEERYDSALLHLSEALVLGEKHAEYYLNYITELKSIQEKLDEENEIVPDLQTSALEESLVTNRKPTQPKKVSEEERKKKYQEKLARVKEKLGIIPLTLLNDMDPIRKIEFSFLNDEVKKEFQSNLENKKLTEIIDDISDKPWATEGVGKPEVLKGKFKNYKGCLSRRINGEDRLVYKVTGPRRVLILSCEGHYSK